MATIFWLSIYGVHIDATWRIRLNRPCAAAMRPCQITLTTCCWRWWIWLSCRFAATRRRLWFIVLSLLGAEEREVLWFALSLVMDPWLRAPVHASEWTASC